MGPRAVRVDRVVMKVRPPTLRPTRRAATPADAGCISSRGSDARRLSVSAHLDRAKARTAQRRRRDLWPSGTKHTYTHTHASSMEPPSPPPPVVPQTAIIGAAPLATLRFLSYNIFVRPPGIKNSGQPSDYKARARRHCMLSCHGRTRDDARADVSLRFVCNYLPSLLLLGDCPRFTRAFSMRRSSSSLSSGRTSRPSPTAADGV